MTGHGQNIDSVFKFAPVHPLPQRSSVQPALIRCELNQPYFVNEGFRTVLHICCESLICNGVKPLPSQGALHSLSSLNRLDGRGEDVERGSGNVKLFCRRLTCLSIGCSINTPFRSWEHGLHALSSYECAFSVWPSFFTGFCDIILSPMSGSGSDSYADYVSTPATDLM